MATDRFTARFTASVQYSDLTGTAAADRADTGDADSWLEKNGYKKPEELLAGITMLAGENHGKHEDPVVVTFLLTSLADASASPVPVRPVCINMELMQFFGLFKRFEIAISLRGELTNKEYVLS